ncbi:unknown [Prevotella sp. CAG:924]|nr:unknown [Prevotella sp. CAG:924]
MMGLYGNETFIEGKALLLKHADSNFYPSFPNALHPPSLHLGKRVDTAADTTAHSLTDYQIGTGRRLAPMAAGFEAHIDGCSRQQRLILRPHGSKGIHLGMSLATHSVPSLTDDPSVTTHDHSPHHRIRFGVAPAIDRQLQTSPHIHLVYFFLCHCSLFLINGKDRKYLVDTQALISLVMSQP